MARAPKGESRENNPVTPGICDSGSPGDHWNIAAGRHGVGGNAVTSGKLFKLFLVLVIAAMAAGLLGFQQLRVVSDDTAKFVLLGAVVLFVAQWILGEKKRD